MLLRFEGNIEAAYLALLPTYTAVLVASRFAANLLLRLHRWSFRLSGLQDGARVVVAAAGGTGAFVLVLFLLGCSRRLARLWSSSCLSVRQAWSR
jgi:integral membrane sensor domain MASE1